MTTVSFKLGGTLEFITEPSKAGSIVTLRHGAFTVTARGEGMAYTLAAGMQVHIQIAYVDAHGNSAAVDGDVTWQTSDLSIAEIAVDAGDTTKAIVQAVGATGLVQITATADADLGEGIRELITLMDVEVVAGEAIAGTISPIGGAEPIPPTA